MPGQDVRTVAEQFRLDLFHRQVGQDLVAPEQFQFFETAFRRRVRTDVGQPVGGTVGAGGGEPAKARRHVVVVCDRVVPDGDPVPGAAAGLEAATGVQVDAFGEKVFRGAFSQYGLLQHRQPFQLRQVGDRSDVVPIVLSVVGDAFPAVGQHLVDPP